MARLAVSYMALVPKMTILFYIALTILGSSLSAWANTITSVSGTVTHGSNITIAGTTFGSKGGTDANKPLIWADFETSINPTSLGVLTAWDFQRDLVRSAALPQYGTSGFNERFTYVGATQANYGQNAIHMIVTTLYMYGQRRYEGIGTNHKMVRIWSDGPGTIDVLSATANGGMIYDEGCIQAERFQHVTIPLNVWHTDEVLWRKPTVGSCGGVNSTGNGYFEFLQDGVRIQSLINNLAGLPSANYGIGGNGPGIILFDNFASPGGDGPPDGTNIYMDNLYMDNTWAHVIIGNASTLAASTQREIQIPTAWADGSITVQVNRGNFGASASAWLYVIDATNTPSGGFPITFGGGGGGDITPPAAPTNLRVQ